MRELLEACLELDILAEETYRRFARDTDDASLAKLFETMREDEEQHVVWWTELLGALARGDNAATVEPQPATVSHLRAVEAAVRCTMQVERDGLTDEDRLAVAASLEYFGLDPVFGHLVSESDPTGFARLTAYHQHLERLAAALTEPGTRRGAYDGFVSRAFEPAVRGGVVSLDGQV